MFEQHVFNLRRRDVLAAAADRRHAAREPTASLGTPTPSGFAEAARRHVSGKPDAFLDPLDTRRSSLLANVIGDAHIILADMIEQPSLYENQDFCREHRFATRQGKLEAANTRSQIGVNLLMGCEVRVRELAHERLLMREMRLGVVKQFGKKRADDSCRAFVSRRAIQTSSECKKPLVLEINERVTCRKSLIPVKKRHPVRSSPARSDSGALHLELGSAFQPNFNSRPSGSTIAAIPVVAILSVQPRHPSYALTHVVELDERNDPC
jgi:hypothetical protein